jgi:hypothetical protein
VSAREVVAPWRFRRTRSVFAGPARGLEIEGDQHVDGGSGLCRARLNREARENIRIGVRTIPCTGHPQRSRRLQEHRSARDY